METIICLHGSASAPSQWRSLVERLDRQHPRYQTVAPVLDGRGIGAGAVFRTKCFDADVDAVTAIASAARGPVHLVGHGYGAAVALRVAQLDTASIQGVVAYEPLLFSLLRARSDEPTLGRLRALAARLERHVARGETIAAAHAFVEYWGGEVTWQAMSDPQRRALAQRIDSADRQYAALLESNLPVQAFRRVRPPVLLVHGSRTPAPARRIAQVLLETLPWTIERGIPCTGHLDPIVPGGLLETLVERFLDGVEEPPLAPPFVSVWIPKAA